MQILQDEVPISETSDMIHKFKMETTKVPRTREIVRKPKLLSPEFWAFLEEIDAPQWVDFALERSSDCQERDDSWFNTVHSFHQKSFHDLMPAAPLAVQTKGKVKKPVHFDAGPINSVSKTRGSKPFPRNKLGGIPIDLSGMDKPQNCQTRLAKGKPMPFKSNGNINLGRSGSVQKLSENAATTSLSQIPIIGKGLKNSKYEQIDEQVQLSTVGTLSNQSDATSSQIPSEGNELRNQIDERVNTLPVSGPTSQSVSSGPTSQSVYRTTELLSMLKMASLRRSCGMLPMRVEVKDTEEPKDRNSSNKVNSGSLGGRTRKISSIGLSNSNSQQVKKEGKVILKKPGQNSTISPIEHDRKNSSIGSSSTIVEKTQKGREATVDQKKARGALQGAGRKQGQLIKEISRGSSRRQGQLTGARNCNIPSTQTTNACRKPLQNVHNAVLSQRKVDMLQNQGFAGKENNHLGTIQISKVKIVEEKKCLTNYQGHHARSDGRQWEKISGRSSFSLSQMQREKANKEVPISKSRYR